MPGVFDEHSCQKGQCQVYGNDESHPLGRQAYFHPLTEDVIFEYTHYDGEEPKFKKRFWDPTAKTVKIVDMDAKEKEVFISKAQAQIGGASKEQELLADFVDKSYVATGSAQLSSAAILNKDNSTFVNQEHGIIATSGTLTSTTGGPCILLALVSPGGKVALAHIDVHTFRNVNEFIRQFNPGDETKAYIIGGDATKDSIETAKYIHDEVVKSIKPGNIAGCEIGGKYKGQHFSVSIYGTVSTRPTLAKDFHVEVPMSVSNVPLQITTVRPHPGTLLFKPPVTHGTLTITTEAKTATPTEPDPPKHKSWLQRFRGL